MRHKNKKNNLGRTAAHKGAMMSNMATSLIMHKRIFTTVPKAKELRRFVEPIITKSKDDTTSSRRLAFSKLKNKYAVTELFQIVSEKVADRPGGYTRIIKTGYRLGDNAAMCFIELVDFNENMLKETESKQKRTRRSRRGGKSADSAVAAQETVAKVQKEVSAENIEKADKPAQEESADTPQVSEE